VGQRDFIYKGKYHFKDFWSVLSCPNTGEKIVGFFHCFYGIGTEHWRSYILKISLTISSFSNKATTV
jgi:hypothetical protein